MEIWQLPIVIRQYIDASNKPDPEMFVNCFSEDAIVLDEGKKRTGRSAIQEWSNQYHFGANVTLAFITAKQVGDEVIATFKLDGTYDKTGLPDPLLLDHHYRIVDNRIVELSIVLAKE